MKPELLELADERNIGILQKKLTAFDEETEESPYSRIEIFWPFSLLEVYIESSMIFGN